MPRKHLKVKQADPAKSPRHERRARSRNLTWLWIGLGGIIVVVIGIFLASSKPIPSLENSPTQTSPSVEISPAQAYAMFQQGAFFLDVRSREEWNEFHITGSTLIPLDQLQNRLSELPKDKDIVVVCLSGHRSQSGTTILLQAGFTHVSCLTGGLRAWMDANYPVEKATP